MRVSDPRRQFTSSLRLQMVFLAGLLFCLSAWISPPSVQADPISGEEENFLSVTGSTSIALDTHHNRLYMGLASGMDNVRCLVLDSQGDTTTTWIDDLDFGDDIQGLSLDAQRNRLYAANNESGLASEVQVITLNTSGDITTGAGHDGSNSGARALALDAERNRLYVGLEDSADGLMVITLNSAGDYLSSGILTTKNQVNALALDAARNKLYVGYNGGAVGTCDLVGGTGIDAGNISSVNNTKTAGTGNITSLALDSFNNRLYVGTESDTDNIYTFDLVDNALPDAGELIAVQDVFDATVPVYCLALDATRQQLYLGVAVAGTNDLRRVGLDTSHYPTGVPDEFVGDNVNAIALDAGRQRLYTVGDRSYSYELTEMGMPALLINHGESTADQTTVNLHWSLPNAHFVRVDTSDLVSYDFPAPGNTNFNTTWYSTDDERWGISPGPRATTLTVQAQLAPGDGPKWVRIWFKEDAGGSSAGGVSHYHEKTIWLSVGTPTFTPTFAGTPTFTPTFAGTPTSTPTINPTGTITPTATPSPTLTRTPTFTQSGTPTLTNTATPTLTETLVVSSTPSSTVTMTASITPTSTVSPTITRTPTLTPTLPPTATPTPAALFFLDKNRFTPGREQLGLKIGLLNNESGELKIFTLSGRLVWQRSLGAVAGGYQRIFWDGRNQNGETVASGVYFLVLQRDDQKIIRKVLVIK